MAKRVFAMPGIHELSKEQENARALPKNGQHLIIGGPGTGKSVVALLRAYRHHEDKDNYVFLVYNHLLHQASRALFIDQLASQTWKSWFMNTFRNKTKQQVPMLPPKPGLSWQDIDWDQVLEIIRTTAPDSQTTQFPYLIIDEGQDMPPQFYEALVNLGFENFYVVADQNQQIVSGHNSSRQDIEMMLAVDTGAVVDLKDNYRNSHPTARLAMEFYTGDPASPRPELPPVQRSAMRPLLREYGAACEETLRHVIDNILRLADRDPSKLIGVIAPNNSVREAYLKALTSAELQLDNGKPHIQTYANGIEANLAFDEGGIVVINAQSCKGLEFDTVFLADIDQHFCNHNYQDEKKRLFYVMVARARDNLIMLRNADKHCPIEVILPKDLDILARRR